MFCWFNLISNESWAKYIRYIIEWFTFKNIWIDRLLLWNVFRITKVSLEINIVDNKLKYINKCTKAIRIFIIIYKIENQI